MLEQQCQIICWTMTCRMVHKQIDTATQAVQKKRCVLFRINNPVQQEPMQQQSVVVASGYDLFACWPE
jgi:hypothetical protein